MSQITVGRWGKNLAIRFPGDIARAVGLGEGEQVEIETRGSEIVIRRATPHFTLGKMFRGRTAEEWRAEYSGAVDWGPDLGREIVEE